MDQRRDGRWTGHRVGQPNVQRKLGRLTTGADKESERNPRQQAPVSECFQRIISGLGENIAILRRAKGRNHTEDRQCESEVTDAIGNEGLARGIGCFLAFEVVTNQ